MQGEFQKTNRIFTKLKKWTWPLIPIIAFGGLLIPKIGLLLLPIMLTLLIMGFLKGKYWCGNLCPHAGLFDYLLLPLAPMKAFPRFMTNKLFRTSFFLFYMSMFIYRLITVAPAWGTLDYWDKLGFLMAINYLVPTLIGTTLALTINPRSWCTFCPMGMMQELAYELRKRIGVRSRQDRVITMKNTAACKKCNRCNTTCPIQLSPYKNLNSHHQFVDNSCLKCSVCVEKCPLGLLSLENVNNEPDKSNHPTCSF